MSFIKYDALGKFVLLVMHFVVVSFVFVQNVRKVKFKLPHPGTVVPNVRTLSLTCLLYTLLPQYAHARVHGVTQ